MSKHTVGTFKDGSKGWKAVPYEKKVGFATHEIHWSDDGECVAEIVHGEADAKLIAAAPDLLNACFNAMGICNLSNDAEKYVFEQLKAAFDKAVGS